MYTYRLIGDIFVNNGFDSEMTYKSSEAIDAFYINNAIISSVSISSGSH